MTQKVLQVGSSAGITLSPELLKILKVKVGQKVKLTFSERLGVVVVKSSKNKAPVDLKIIDLTESFIDNYGDALRALAKK